MPRMLNLDIDSTVRASLNRSACLLTSMATPSISWWCGLSGWAKKADANTHTAGEGITAGMVLINNI